MWHKCEHLFVVLKTQYQSDGMQFQDQHQGKESFLVATMIV